MQEPTRLNRAATLCKGAVTQNRMPSKSVLVHVQKVQSMFGYLRPEMEGKNVAMLMPPPFSMQHHTFLRSYKQTQKGNLLGTGPREVIALHKEGYVFPVKVTIEKSVATEGYTGVFHEVGLPCSHAPKEFLKLVCCDTHSLPDLTMLSLTVQVQEDPRAGIAWVSGEGQLYCVSKGFMALMGYSFHDMRRNIQSIGEMPITAPLLFMSDIFQQAAWS